jgi:pimeloyl-ACP methyl ester carboxylesterase
MTVKCPVTVVRSSGDLFVDPANSDFIHRQIKGSSLLSHPTAGHELAFEDPDWLSSMIQNFATETANEHRLV